MHADASSNGRSLAAIISEMRDELKQFVQTRMELLKREIQVNLGVIRAAAPLIALAVLFLTSAYLLLTIALVALIATAFAGSEFAWFFAFLIVGMAWLMIGAMAGFMAVREFRKRGFMPRRTMEVLKADNIWLQKEAKSHL
jgi:hypothetical protein